jgi:DNA-binding winged helix-turn-helix (wHTH) protein
VHGSAKPGSLIRFGVFELDLCNRELRKKGFKVKLQQQPLDLLQILLEGRPDAITREEIRERLWPTGVHVDFDRSLNKAVAKLRSALGDDAESPRFVETLSRYGYRFIAPVTANPEPLTSIAVLPFLFLNEIEDRKAFSLGFADALITTLSSIEDIAVLPISAVLDCVSGTDPARTCRDLDVHQVLQGSVQKLGSHWRVSTRLFDNATRKITYLQNHDFVHEDVFEVQDEIGRRVVESLQTRLPRAAQKARDRYSSDPEAFEEFMAALPESYSDREETLRSAAHHLSKAVERDPEFALAHATLSQVAMHIHWEFDSERAWLDKAEHHCVRALALDPALPEGHSARAFILWSPARNFQHADAIAALEQVLTARPNDERAHNRMATICWHIGRFEEGYIAHHRARCSNPKTRTNNLEFI